MNSVMENNISIKNPKYILGFFMNSYLFDSITYDITDFYETRIQAEEEYHRFRREKKELETL